MQNLANLVRPEGDPKIVKTGPSSVYPEERLAKSLGWASLGLGLFEILAAPRITRTLGLEGMEPLVRAFGAREIASGVVTLSTEKEAGLWSRVAGDAMDLAALSNGLAHDNPKRSNLKLAMCAIAGIALLDALAASAVTARKRRPATPRSYRDRSGFPKGLTRAKHGYELSRAMH
ncbi:hypothetical protein [Hyphomicrobium sp.]|uniref:hypothetical protein n=1 Tax=Hyphomicrobium sp. TaxID=82 RepID=UPI002FDCD0C9